MSKEEQQRARTPNDGKLQRLVEVRTSDDGITYAGMQLPGSSEWMVLLTVPAQAYTGSTEVQAAVLQLASAVVRQMLSEALPGAEIERAHVIAPGSQIDGPKH